MKLIITLAAFLLATAVFASPYYTAQTPGHVRGYIKSDGTYVQPYYRAEPNTRQNSYGSSYGKRRSSSSRSFGSNHRSGW